MGENDATGSLQSVSVAEVSGLGALELANALSVVFEYGFELMEEHFIELTAEQYESLARQDEDASKRWIRISRGVFEDRNNPPAELPIVSELEKERLLRAVELVNQMSEDSGRTFDDFRARLAYLRDRLPPAVTGVQAQATTSRKQTVCRPAAGKSDRQPTQAAELPVAGCLEGRRAVRSQRNFDRIRALQDDGHLEAARDQLIDFILWQSDLEAQLEAVKLLARRPTHRTLHYLEHIYKSEIIDRGPSKVVVYPQAPRPLGEAMQRSVCDLGSEAHQVVRSAIGRTYDGLARAAASGGQRKLDDLLRVVSPPDPLIDSGRDDDEVWHDVEFRLGLDLPLDFKQVLRAYGSGSWGSSLWMLNPFSRDPDLNLERSAHDLLARDHKIRRGLRESLPFALYPEKDGLFPWAFTTQGHRLYFLTEGLVENWPIIVFEPRGFCYDRHNAPVTDFLFQFVSGAFSSRVMGAPRPECRWAFRPRSMLKAAGD